MTGLPSLADLRRMGDITQLLQAIPYIQFLGVTGERNGEQVTLTLRYSPQIIGNPTLPALHGGVIGAFLETTAIVQLVVSTETDRLPKPVDIGIDYLRTGRPLDTYAAATITKHGRRVANVRAEAWQEDRSRPIAALHGHFLMSGD